MVARVVGQDRDPLGVEVGVHHEQVILEPASALGKADAVLVEERPAEQLVRREHARAAAAESILSAAAVLPEQRARHRLAVADHLPDHDVRVVARGRRVETLERLGPEPVVVVDEVDVLAARHVDADVARPPWPAGIRYVLRPACADVARRARPAAPACRRSNRRRRRSPRTRSKEGIAPAATRCSLDVLPRVVDRDDRADLHGANSRSTRARPRGRRRARRTSRRNARVALGVVAPGRRRGRAAPRRARRWCRSSGPGTVPTKSR